MLIKKYGRVHEILNILKCEIGYVFRFVQQKKYLFEQII